MNSPQNSPAHQANLNSNLNMQASISRFHQGIEYLEYLKQVHRVCKPSSYFEIGVQTGQTLAFAECPSVGVDPDFSRLTANPAWQKPEAHLFRMTSDDFFAKHNLKTFLPNGPDFAFLDGMHLFEFLLRDFMNTERHSQADAIVALHDCYPVNAEMADREENYARRADMATRLMWAGDVWKLLPILRDYRPDLEVTVLDCPPTGLVMIRRLDASSRALIDAYDEIVAKYQHVNLETFGIERFRNEFPTVNSRSLFEPDAMRRFLARYS